MKRFFLLLFAACAILPSCSNKKSGSDPEKSTPVVNFEYEVNDVAKKALTVTLTVDGQKYNLDKSSDSQTIKLASDSGTIEMECTSDSSIKYTEKQDVTVIFSVIAGSISPDGSGYTSMKSVVEVNMVLKGLQADKVSESLSKTAKNLCVSKTYTVSSSGTVTIQ